MRIIQNTSKTSGYEIVKDRQDDKSVDYECIYSLYGGLSALSPEDGEQRLEWIARRIVLFDDEKIVSMLQESSLSSYFLQCNKDIQHHAIFALYAIIRNYLTCKAPA